MIWSKKSDGVLVSVKNVTGEQAGAYFGYALAVGDFNGECGLR